MAENFYTILTDVGLAKVANAQITQEKIDIVEMAVGDGNGSYYNPSSAQTTLVKEVWRGLIGLVGIDETNDHWINIESAIPANQGGFFIREVGLFDADGDLVAVGKYPETYKPKVDEGSTKDLYIRMIIEVSNTTAVILKVDPTVIIATRKFVDDKVALAVGPINRTLQELQDDFESLKREVESIPSDLVNDQELQEVKDDVDEHKAEDASLAKKGHVQLSSDTDSESESLAATPKAIKEVMKKAQEAFRLGNSRKKELVDLLLSLDDSLLIDYSLSWEDILGEGANVSTGKKWAEGSSTSGNTDVRSDMTGSILNTNSLYSFQVTGLNFEPSIVIISPSSAAAINNHPLVYKKDGIQASSREFYTVINDVIRYTLGGAAYVKSGEFDLPIRSRGVIMNWIAFE